MLLSTAGVVFLATPFFGSGVSRVFQWQVLVRGIMGDRASDRLIEDLGQKADFVYQRVQKFAEMANSDAVRLPICCFFETKETQMIRHLLPVDLAKWFSSLSTHNIVRHTVVDA